MWRYRRTIAGVGLLIASSAGLVNALHERHQQRLTYSEFARTLPPKGWYHITGTRLDLAHVLKSDTTQTKPYYIVMVRDASDTDDAGAAALVTYSTVIPTQRDSVDGTLMSSSFSRPDQWDTDRSRLGRLVTADPRILFLDATPGFFLNTILFVIGLCLSLLLLIEALGNIGLWLDRRRRGTKSAQP